MSLLLKMTLDKKELSRLSPQERIKRLRLMEEDRKKEVDEIERLIKDSMQELRTARIAEEITPEQRPVDISRLFETTNEQRLERTAKQGTPPPGLMKGRRGYITFEQAYETYTQLKKFDSAISMGSALTEEEKNLIGKAGERIIADRYAPVGEETATLLDAGRAIFYKLERDIGLPRRLRS